MTATTTWHLPYPEGTDAPLGAEQIRALAAATDAEISDMLTRPDPVWARLTTDTQSVASGASVYLGLTIAEQHASNRVYSTATTTVKNTIGGTFAIFFRIRSIATGTPASGGYMQAAIESPSGVRIYDTLSGIWGAGWDDIEHATIFTWSTANTLAIKVTNVSTGQIQNIQTSRIGLYRIGN